MRWDFKGWLGLQLLAAVLLFTWWQGYWLSLDEGIFWWFNRRLVTIPGFAELVAFLNQRWIDGVVALLMALFVFRHAGLMPGRERIRTVCLLLIMAGCFSLQAAAGKALPVERPSPTLVYEQAERVTQLIPELTSKDASEDSFPSDHGIGFATFLLFAIYRFPRRYLYIVMPLVLALAMPRLMSGAHWFTDFICGSVPLALFTAAWLFHTPLANWLTDILAELVEKLWRRWPPQK
ncbi:phosphatase PAP2 family protein [Oceanimonas baumannii]|uniref:PA-phosphatase n=1 Tax=Oceanimonas baumannii TaxID=129578 RepID=A0A235CJ27_9GAMM|nr:phosphatase PAP2 family protein [Oceanimonas baumannii]OYD24542.1 PA-phosphatase [Oceanimonas baumannii]TDW59275.1 PAP2 superfamily protein [Oceanimonas baumannii]